jgi:prolyl-tRNA synthetase
MRLSQLVGRRIKETPKDAQTVSHTFLIRGGYVRPVSAGIYSMLPAAVRIKAKLETILREEMHSVEGQEVLMPVVLPRELWEESGRYNSVGPELLRFQDRNEKDMLLGMTHEEAVVHLVRTDADSYKQLPFMLYQIQTKYRDEARPRAGLIRVREFTMKDAYSFHESETCLQKYYQRVLEAYSRYFKRVGLKDVVVIESDPGMIGGNASHEFMAIADCGEDTIFMSPDGTYLANKEIATANFVLDTAPAKQLEKVHTPGATTIDQVAKFLGVESSQTAKAVFYQDADEKLVFAVIRGDLEINETKLKNLLKTKELKFATDAAIRAIGAVPGYASPLNIQADKIRIVFDPTAAKSSNLVVGANEVDYHYTGFNFARDMAALAPHIQVKDIATIREGDPCPVTGKPLLMKRGIEVGNIFQLGVKYSQPMRCNFLDRNGKSHPMVMGCYGIGLGRTMAAVVEQSYDQYGPIWPVSIAPWHVQIIALNRNQEPVQKAADALYEALTLAGVEVLYDDRNEKAGVAFNEADLLGVPFRVVVSPKSLEKGEVEYKRRDGSEKGFLPVSDAVSILKQKVSDALAASR